MIRYCSYSDRGTRSQNEDFLGTWPIRAGLDNYILLAVADGLGGHQAGEVASRIAVETLEVAIRNSFHISGPVPPDHLGGVLNKAFLHAAAVVSAHARQNAAFHGMATTLTCALLNNDGDGVIAHAGDSRAYRIHEEITQLTKDHSVVQGMVEQGHAAPVHIHRHPLKHRVTRALGMDSCRPDLYPLRLESGSLLLCTDGLTEGLPDEEIYSIVSTTTNQAGCRFLVESAKQKSRDNISVILAYPGESGPGS